MRISIAADPSHRLLKISQWFWALQALTPFVFFIGVGPIAGQVGLTTINVAILAYLSAIYAVMRGRFDRPFGAAQRHKFGPTFVLTVIFLAWAGVSLFWTPGPAIAACFYLNTLVPAFLVYRLCKMFPVNHVLIHACIGTLYGALLTMPLTVVLTGYTGGRLGFTSDGFFIVPHLAYCAAVGIMSAAYLRRQRKISSGMLAFSVGLFFVELNLTFAKTEIVALTAVALLYVVLSELPPAKKVWALFISVSLIAGAIFADASKISTYAERSEGTGAATLTGRTLIWDLAITKLSKGPWIRGFGYMSFSRIGPSPFAGTEHLAHAHNEWVNTWFNFGLVGVFLLLLMYVTFLYRGFKANRKRLGMAPTLAFCSMIFCLIRGVGQANATSFVYPLPWLLLFDFQLTSVLVKAKGKMHDAFKMSRSRTR